MRVATPPRLPDEPQYAPRPTTDAARARYSRAPAAGRLTLRTTACGLFDLRRTAHPPHLAVGGPHAVVPNLVSTPPTPLAGFDPSTEEPAVPGGGDLRTDSVWARSYPSRTCGRRPQPGRPDWASRPAG